MPLEHLTEPAEALAAVVAGLIVRCNHCLEELRDCLVCVLLFL